MRRRFGSVLVVAAIGLVSAVVGVPGAVPVAPAAAVGEFTAKGSVNQVYTYGHPVGATVELLTGSGSVVATGTADAQGAYLFKGVPAGTGYQVRDGATTVSDLVVTDPGDNPADSWYAQQAATNPLHAGFGYLTTRDGTKLSINITMPIDESTLQPKRESDGPFPIVVNYSGYDPSQPGSPPQEAAVYPYQGYVTVGVNLRGTTCSGGAFDFLEPLQGTDGYDVIETLAHQSWANGHVGMVGISYSGFSQLYVGATNPPHLDAITPFSPFGDTYSGILYPGGILNDGFALGWATERANDAKPKAHTWVKNRINAGDTTCAANQVMRLQSRDLLSYLTPDRTYEPQYSYLDVQTIVPKIKVPTYLMSQWQDEQTGGSAAWLAALFPPEAKLKATFTNGTHVEPEAPSELQEAMNFIDLYVGKRIPRTASPLILGGPEQIASLFGESDTSNFQFPFNIWNLEPTYAKALSDWEAQPPIRIRWENGGVSGKEGLPLSPTESRYAAFPVPGTVAQSFYLQPDGGLGATAPAVPDTAARASSSYQYDPSSKRDHTFDGSTDAAWTRHPDVHWDVLAEGKSLSFVSAPFTTKTAYAGTGSVDLWLTSTAADTDLEVTLTEVRPDGQERYVQSGWLRASHRKLNAATSTELRPIQTNLAADVAPLPAGQFTPVRVSLFPFAHVVRPGSRLRVSIEAPGGNQDFWAFNTLAGGATNSIGHSAGMPSRIVLPKLPSAPNVADTAPPCVLSGNATQSASLRNQPCRPYQPARVPTAVTAAPSGDGVVVGWTAPAGDPPTSFRVTLRRAAGDTGTSALPDPLVVAGTATTTTFPDVPRGAKVEAVVDARYGSTWAPASDASLPARANPVKPWSTVSGFVTRSLTDSTGSAPAAKVAAGVAAIDGGQSAEDYLVGLRRGTDATSIVDPVARLYLAYFLRNPDPAGLDHWRAARRSGTSLATISAGFAGSAEFKARYGSLSNRAFVQLVYTNVLGRAGDPAGVDYWTGQLDQRKKTRGAVMVGFSESAEFRRTSRNRVDVAVLYVDLLRKTATPAQTQDAVARLVDGTPLSTIVGELLDTATYAARAS